jgi:NADH:ubiquinone oxidoreductase subunit 1 (chain H)
MIDALAQFFAGLGTPGMVIWTLIKIACIALPLPIAVAFYVLAERRVIGTIQWRYGPIRVGPYGLLQSFADLGKMLFKEIIWPQRANKVLFTIAPAIVVLTAMASWAVIPLSDKLWLANIDASLLYIMMLSSVGVYGIILAGWSANSRFAFLGAMRSTAQLISYELAMGFALVGVVLLTHSLNLLEIVHHQEGGILNWHIWPLLPLFFVYWFAGIAETNRHPFDMAEGESELVAGFHVEHGGITFALFFLAEYINMIIVSVLIVILFLGGWMAPFAFMNELSFWDIALLSDGPLWLVVKVVFFLFAYLWIRATFPRYRYDQIMRLGWKIFIPLTLFWVVVVAVATQWSRLVG